MEASVPAGESSVAGGSGDDTHRRAAPAATASNGRYGRRRAQGGSGNDSLAGREDSDRLSGGPGTDTLKGESGFDSLFGNNGTDTLDAGSGNDFIDAKEPVGTTALKDTISCGDGSDRVEADLQDVFVLVGECENAVDLRRRRDPAGSHRRRHAARPPQRAGPRAASLPPGRGLAGLQGPALAAARPPGRPAHAQALRDPERPQQDRHRRLSRGSVRTLSSRQRRGRRTRGILTSVERGRKGRKTAVRNPRLRLR